MDLNQRRGLRVILFSDVVDSSGRMFADEAGTVALIQRDLGLFARHVGACGGELIKNTGDGILATFPSTLAALTFLQQALRDLRGLEVPGLQHRFGMHLGEIHLQDDDILGQGVHLAARLQTVSPVNGVAFTQGTWTNLDPAFRQRAIALGSLELKGLPGRVPCHALQERALIAGADPDPALSWRSRLSWLVRRLRRSTPAQAAAAAVLVSLALLADLDPAQPFSTYLLDRRLHIQKRWRQATGQPGPRRPPLPVLLLESPETLVPRAQLNALLASLPPERFPAVAFDLVLDQPGPDPQAVSRLAQRIRSQARAAVYGGFFAAGSAGSGAGRRSLPLPQLLAAGLRPRDLTISTAASSGPVQPTPLRLLAPITPKHLAGTLAGPGAGVLPADSVIDWSLDWGPMLRVVTPEQLRGSRAPLLLVGRFSERGASQPDLFETPAAFLQPDPIWGGSSRELPGPLLQAVLGQSLALRHWLTPLSSAACVALAAAGGVLLAAALPSRRRRLVVLVLGLPPGLLLSLQLAAGSLVLTPILLPSLALGFTSLLRRD